jgi:hypothetical protein
MVKVLLLFGGIVIGAMAAFILIKFSTDTNQPSSQTMASYICQWGTGTRESALMIKSDKAGAKEIIFPWRTDGDRFQIDKTTDLHYFATNVEEKYSRVSTSTMELNRVTGEMQIINRYTPEALKIVVGACNKTIPDCANRLKEMGGGDLSCFILPTDCPRFLEGNNFQMRSQYTCRAADRRF